jgi:hypothetical protein
LNILATFLGGFKINFLVFFFKYFVKIRKK